MGSVYPKVLCAFCHADKTAREGQRRAALRRAGREGDRQARFDAIVGAIPWFADLPWTEVNQAALGGSAGKQQQESRRTAAGRARGWGGRVPGVIADA